MRSGLAVSVLFGIVMGVLCGCQGRQAAGQRAPRATPDPGATTVTQTPSMRVEETRLGELPADWQRIHPQQAVSRDGLHVAQVIPREGMQAVAVDGCPGEWFDEVGGILHVVGCIGMRVCAEFSEDGHHAAYASRRGEQWHAVIDGEAGPGYDEIRMDGGLVFSLDGQRFAYAARRGDQWTAVVDGRESPLYDQVYALRFSPDSRRVTYAGIRKQGNDVLVRDDEVMAEAQVLDNHSATFSPDGRRFACIALLPDPVVVVDGEAHPSYGEVANWSLTFSPDSQHFAYVAYSRDQWRLVLDGEPGAICTRIGCPRFSPNSSMAFYDARKGDKAVLVSGEEESPEYDDIGALTPSSADGTGSIWDVLPIVQFSPNGKRVAYRAKLADEWFVVVDGREGPAFTAIAHGAFSPDGKSFAYAASPEDGKWAVVVDGEVGPLWDNWRAGPVFSPDGQRLAYAADRGELGKDAKRARLIVDDQESPPYEMVSLPAFSLDSSHVACAVRSDGKSWVVIDGEDGPKYDALLGPAVCSREAAFGPDGSLQYLATRDQDLLRVRHVPLTSQL